MKKIFVSTLFFVLFLLNGNANAMNKGNCQGYNKGANADQSGILMAGCDYEDTRSLMDKLKDAFKKY